MDKPVIGDLWRLPVEKKLGYQSQIRTFLPTPLSREYSAA
jgi:hypothetical protein